MAAIGELGRRVSQVESGGIRYVETEPEPKADLRVADPESLSDFQRTLLEQTHDVPSDFDTRPRRTYNYDPLWYLKPDGSFVQLQGSPQARAHYVDKGYRELNEEEARHFVQVERPRILKEQRVKAHLINTIRKMFQREPSLAGFREDPDYDTSLDLMSIARLEDEWEDLRSRSVNPGQKLPPLPRFRSDVDTESKRMLSDVETNAMSMEEFQARTARGRRTAPTIR
jgi:hypothetical protein